MEHPVEPAKGSADAQSRQAAGGRRCSREMLWTVLTSKVLAGLSPQFRFCEVTGDAPQWLDRILEKHPEATGVALSGMTNAKRESGEAPPSSDTQCSGGRLQTSRNDLASYGLEMEDHSFDLTFSLNGALARVERPDVALGELVRITRPGGLVVCLVPNLYHVVLCNLARGSFEDAERALEGRARIAPGGQELNLFTRTTIEEALRRAGACPRATEGLPAIISPWHAYGEPKESGEVAAKDPEVDDYSEKVWTIEQALFAMAHLAPVGTSLLSVAAVPSSTEHWGDFWLPSFGSRVLNQVC
jgi:SAM-dependent methyltransferase